MLLIFFTTLMTIICIMLPYFSLIGAILALLLMRLLPLLVHVGCGHYTASGLLYVSCHLIIFSLEFLPSINSCFPSFEFIKKISKSVWLYLYLDLAQILFLRLFPLSDRSISWQSSKEIPSQSSGGHLEAPWAKT